jgi:hypothetical protein
VGDGEVTGGEGTVRVGGWWWEVGREGVMRRLFVVVVGVVVLLS